MQNTNVLMLRTSWIRTLPPHEAFHSTQNKWISQRSSTGSSITCEEYYCQQVREREARSTMEDFLKWYNDGDTKPFLDAIQKMSAYVWSRNLHIFKNGISLPWLAMIDTFTDMGMFFLKTSILKCTTYWRERWLKSLLWYITDSSGIWCIRTKLGVQEYEETAKLCRSVKGFDATWLHLSCLSKPMATGYQCRRTDNDAFRLRRSTVMNRCRENGWLGWPRRKISKLYTNRERESNQNLVEVDSREWWWETVQHHLSVQWLCGAWSRLLDDATENGWSVKFAQPVERQLQNWRKTAKITEYFIEQCFQSLSWESVSRPRRNCTPQKLPSLWENDSKPGVKWVAVHQLRMTWSTPLFVMIFSAWCSVTLRYLTN